VAGAGRSGFAIEDCLEDFGRRVVAEPKVQGDRRGRAGPPAAITTLSVMCVLNPGLSASVGSHFAADGFAAGFPQKMNVPRVVEVTISTAPSLFKSTASIVDPTPERL
jgi:hypothetical protein